MEVMLAGVNPRSELENKAAKLVTLSAADVP
ncbi:hypothetical protein Bra1253DRAFT_05993 [Bradyrhizobium sp. WSM1253]|nr:hypothetical protein Bra1253DRAFT_05993 [Bradyrhizobium sp. WSM1253]